MIDAFIFLLRQYKQNRIIIRLRYSVSTIGIASLLVLHSLRNFKLLVPFTRLIQQILLLSVVDDAGCTDSFGYLRFWYVKKPYNQVLVKTWLHLHLYKTTKSTRLLPFVSEANSITLFRIRNVSEIKLCNVLFYVFRNFLKNLMNENFLLSSLFFTRSRFNSNQEKLSGNLGYVFALH